MQTQINIQENKTTCRKLYQCLGLLFFSLILTACSQGSDPQQGVISDDKLSAPLPKAIAALSVDGSTLIVDVVVNGNTDKPLRVENLVVDTTAGTFSGNVPGFPTGTSTLSLVYSIIDPTQGTVEVITTSDITVTVVANQEAPADFSFAEISYTDTDGDSISNLDELNADTSASIPNYTVSGQVEGLMGSGLVLQNNGGNDLPVSADGTFSFGNASAMTSGSSYTVIVLTQPNSPNQTCAVSNGSGIISGAVIFDITVTCSTISYTIGGTVSGYTGSGLVLQNNGSDDLAISKNGTFIFISEITDGDQYAVSVQALPSSPNQACTVSNGSGVINGVVVTDIDVICSTASYTVGGTVTGLNGSGLILRINSGDTLPISTNGMFTFSNALADGSPYLVTVLAQPDNQPQLCTISTGNGMISGANTVNVDVTCTDVTNPFSNPRGIALDIVNGRDRALVADETVVIAVDLTTGERTILSDNTTPNINNPFSSLRGITVDTTDGRNRALVVDQALGSVIAVDLTSGERTVLSNSTTPDSDNPFSFPVDIILDAAHNRALVVAFSLNAVIAVDLTTGKRTVLSNNTTPNANNPFSVLRGITLDRDKNRALVLMEDHLDTVIAVDLSNGTRTILSNNITPDVDTPFFGPRGITLDTSNNRNRALVVDDNLDAILTVDLSNGVRKVLSNSTTPNDNNLFSGPLRIVVDMANGRERALVVDFQLAAVISIDLMSGERTVFSDAVTP
ncbi:MAG: hypothetical protein L3J98_03545 [Gammaproteobacteria bacterium]|nr:hypothetical protein [Gammaproteobacteria bacterium]MCF6259225.1 hypothetical protein [Gammaproteobacteria bacterium]